MFEVEPPDNDLMAVMKLMVDFNKVDKLGRILAVIPDGYESFVTLGSLVTADDGEGTICQALVEEYGPTGRFVYLRPEVGTLIRAKVSTAQRPLGVAPEPQ